MMYNLKVIKYPSGYQVRVYSSPVGFKLEPDEKLELETFVKVYDKEQHEFIEYRMNPDKQWVNVFSGEIEPMPRIIDAFAEERSARVSLNRTVQNIYSLSRSNMFEWFFTLTFNPVKVDSFDYEACTKKLSDWLSNMRKKSPDMKYLVVPEMHKSGRWHFHGLFADCDELGFTDSGKRTSKGNIIYNVSSYKLGFSTATHIEDMERCAKYICKYITKELCAVTAGKRRYWHTRNLVQAESDTMLMTETERQKLIEQLMKVAGYVTSLKSPDMETMYFELPQDVELTIESEEN